MVEVSDANQVTLPCEFCGALVTLDKWDSHWAACANADRIDKERTFQRSLYQNYDTSFPCDYCLMPIKAEHRESHLKQCLTAQVQYIEQITRQKTNDAADVVIPCEYCRKSFPLQTIETHQRDCQRQHGVTYEPLSPSKTLYASENFFPFPNYWNLCSPANLTRHVLSKESDEYHSIANHFHQSLPAQRIIRIERIQNRRWYRQYDAHKDDFIERYGHSTEEWLFHGCSAAAAESIIRDCFNRSHNQRCLAGQGVYFAREAAISSSYAIPDQNNVQRMFMARVLVGRTTDGNASTRVCPAGFDTTGNDAVIVTYHDAQAYGEYLIMFQ